MTEQPPAWFSAALAAPADEGLVDVDGTRVRYRAWGEPGAPGAVLVHGTAAHAHWWDHVGPQMPAGLRIAALDLSGHGDSDWRERYSLEHWAREVLAVASDAGISGPPVLIGHSLGGAIVLRAATLPGAGLAGVVVIDSPLHEVPPVLPPGASPFGGDRLYPGRAEALARFRLVPEQPVLPYIREHIAAQSVRQKEGGEWGWKFDRRLFAKMEPSRPLAGPAGCPVAVLRAEHGMMTAEMVAMIRERIGPVAPDAEIPAAGHHVMLDEPLCLVTALRLVLAGWGVPDEAAGQAA